MTFTVRELAERVSGSIEGDPDRRVEGVAPVDTAGPGQLTYVVNEKYARRIGAQGPAAALVPLDLEIEADGTSFIRVGNPELAFSEIVGLFLPGPESRPGVHPTAVIGKGAILGEGVELAPYATIGAEARIGARTHVGAHCHIGTGVTVGDDCWLAPHCSLMPGAVLGDRVRLHTGARVGVDGFGFTAGRDGRPVKIPQVGRAVIGDDVEIGANATIDRGSLGDTVVGEGTKIDNLVHIGHNCRIGKYCFIVAQVGLAGSSVLEDGVRLAGQVGLAGHLTVGAGASVGAQSGVMTDIPAGDTWSGYPARPHRNWLRSTSVFYKLPELARRVEALEDESGGKTA